MKSTRPKLDLIKIKQTLAQATDSDDLYQKIVNAPFDQTIATAHMFLGIIVLLLVNKKTGQIDRVALSKTEQAQNTLEVSVVPFERIKIPLGKKGNIIAEAIEAGLPQDTTDWKYLFHPALSAKAARINQASGGIAYSTVYPFKAKDGGALIFSYYLYEKGVGNEQRDFMRRYTHIVNNAIRKH